jgi:hypothetical protein
MSRQSASVHITKLAAAQRQLDAAIRMTLLNEDQLAVHTVAAAAYRILRDLKRKRGRSELCDNLNSGLFYVARSLALGKLMEMPPEMGSIAPAVWTLVDAIRRGEIKSKFDVEYFKPVRQEANVWRAFNLPSNFLKHADLDSDRTLSLDAVNNDHLLLAGSVAYIDLIGQPTPEMQVYAVFRFVDEWSPPWLSEERVAKLRSTKPALRRRLCFRLLRDFES